MREVLTASWLTWALLSAAFAALTAIFAKIGVEGIDSDLATFIRTVIVVALLAVILVVRQSAQPLEAVSARSWLFLGLSGLATGASWLCYFRALQLGDASRVAPIDKLSVVLVAIFSVALLGEKLEPHHWLGVGLIAGGALLLAR